MVVVGEWPSYQSLGDNTHKLPQIVNLALISEAVEVVALSVPVDLIEFLFLFSSQFVMMDNVTGLIVRFDVHYYFLCGCRGLFLDRSNIYPSAKWECFSCVDRHRQIKQITDSLSTFNFAIPLVTQVLNTFLLGDMLDETPHSSTV